jgi:hypothetical protein
MTVAEVSHTERIATRARTTITGMKVNESWATFRCARLLFHTLMIGVTACVSLFAIPESLVGQTPAFHVLVLDALDGKPQANVKVEPLCVGLPLNQRGKTAFTDNKGIATLSYVCNDKQKIVISVYPPDKKEQCGNDTEMSFGDVASLGVLSDPSSTGGIGEMWCPAKVSTRLKPVPGQVIMFVKKPTWWQSHVAG